MFDENDETWSIASLTDNLSSSYVDTSKLISHMTTGMGSCDHNNSHHEVGMKNFKSLKNRINISKKSSNDDSGSQQQQRLSAACVNSVRSRWRSAAMRAKQLADPWSEFRIIDRYADEPAVRHRYNAIKKQWIKDECRVKMDTVQFANGAMRACYRLKKLSNFVHKDSWEHASNYVAKCYLDAEVPRERYFDDVRVQMDAKLWAEIYNRHNPPKKVDMFQVSILEFSERPGAPLFHLEHFIEGEYIKYNSNSGFVENGSGSAGSCAGDVVQRGAAATRNTPQAFSHFTFECSNHEMIVVDVQGVGDLYTDPQIHTATGTDYGDGNLGCKGFALFFASHQCNDVCHSLGLTAFDLAPSELRARVQAAVATPTPAGAGAGAAVAVGTEEQAAQQSAVAGGTSKLAARCMLTQSRGAEEMVIGSPSSYGEFFRQASMLSFSTGNGPSQHQLRARTRSDTSTCSGDEVFSMADLPELDEETSEGYYSSASTASPLISPQYYAQQQQQRRNSPPLTSNPILIARTNSQSRDAPHVTPRRTRTESSCLDSAFSLDEAVNYFSSKQFQKRRASNVAGNMRSSSGSSTRNHNQNVDEGNEDEDKDNDDDDDDDVDYYRRRVHSLIESSLDNESTLGKIHLELCKYHEIGRFITDEDKLERNEFDMDAAVFHLKQAANLGVAEALANLAKIYLQLPHDILPMFTVEDTAENQSVGFEYMLLSADKGDTRAIHFVAKAFDTGTGLPGAYTIDWPRAYECYQKLLNAAAAAAGAVDDPSQSGGGGGDQDMGFSEPNGAAANAAALLLLCEPVYTILARMAEMNLSGGHGFEHDAYEAASLYTEAADKAMACGKGRLANKYYQLAEEANAQCVEE